MRSMVERVLAEYAVREREAPFSDAVLHQAKRAVIDWFAAMLPGAGKPPATSIAEALADELHRGGAVIYPSGVRTSPRTAALINGTAAHLVEFDDIFRDAIYHPGAPVIAAALAAGESVGASGREILTAVIVGYEISTRIAVALTPAHYKYWHTTGTVGTFGAAAAACTILELDAPRIAHALATAATFGAGLQQAFRADAMSKPLHSGRAAEAGVLAALLAANGVTGATGMFDGERGIGRAMSTNADWSRAVEELGERYNIMSVTVKNHACCGHTFAAIDGALALRRREGIRADEIEQVAVDTYQTALDVTGNHDPATEFEAKFSLPFVVSSALVHGSVRLDAFTPERLSDPAVRRLMSSFQLRADPEMNAAFPGRRSARVRLRTRGGEELEYFQPTRRGDPDLPLTDEELDEKFRELAIPVLGSERGERLLGTLWSLDSAHSPLTVEWDANEEPLPLITGSGT
ncbi:MAG TPA: MmgE/PrpD family protein [Gemmatimonadaceae bacterium]